MLGAMAVAVFAILPTVEPVQDRADLVEINHVYDDCGKHTFTQLIWWDWRRNESEFRVVAWRMLKTDSMRPRFDHASGAWLSSWQDGGRHREVRAATFRESWTQADLETNDRDYLPKEQRRELTNTEGQP